MFNIIQNRKYWFIVSAAFIIPGIIAMVMGGLQLGIDFTGGSLIRIEFSGVRPETHNVEVSLENLDLGVVRAQPLGDKGMSIRLKDIDNTTRQTIIDTLDEKFGGVTEQSFESIGPTIGKELRDRAIIAILLVLLFIIVYISFAFRKIGGGAVRSWVYGLGALVALFHDILVDVGFFAILGSILEC